MKIFRVLFVCALLISVLFVVSVAQSTVVIDEVRTWSGATGVDAQFPSSIELYNTGPSTENLSGWELVTNDGVAFLPSWNVPSGAYLTVILGMGTDDSDLSDGEGIWHVGVDEDLGRYGGEIGLFNAVPSVGSAVDFMRWGWGGSTSGIAFGYATSANIWDNFDYIETSSHSPFSTIGRLPTGQDADTSADWGEIERQYVGSLTLDNPLQVSPRDGTLHQSVPVLRWQLVNTALDYIVELDTDSLFGSPDYADTVSGTSTTIAAAENYYWWRVRPRDSSEVDMPYPAAPWGFAWTTELLLADFIQYGFTPVPQLYQHKDSKLLCLWDVGCENHQPYLNGAGRCVPNRCPNGCSGTNNVSVFRPGCTEASGAQGPWDNAHPTTNGSTYTAADSTHIVNCRHCQQYCTRASIQMINRKYGGTLTQDENSYHLYQTAVPERDLGHQEGAWPGKNGTFSWAMNNRIVEADTAVAPNGPLPWATVMAEIDAGRPLLSVIQQGGHCVVTNGYLSVFNIRFVFITDPWPGNTGWYLNMADVVQNGRNVQRNQRYSQYYRLRAAGGAITGRATDPNLTPDNDGDGVVDFDEGRIAVASAQNPRKLQCFYNQSDTDGDGVGDKQEIRNYTYHRVDNPAFSRTVLNNPAFSDLEGDNARAENDCESDGDFDHDGDEDLNQNGNSSDAGETDPLDPASVELDEFDFCDNIVGGIAIPDNGNVTRTIDVPEEYLITDVNVFVDIIHTADGDLKIQLTSPEGTVVILSNRRGSISDNFCCTWFDDEAGVAISAGSPPFAGYFIPDEALSDFDGENALGEWELKVLDEAANDIGTLNSWCIVIDYDEILPVELLSFAATPLDQAVQLRWTTATETDNDHFEIERDQEIVAMLESESEGSSETNYSWIDRPLQNGRTYTYTLFSVDVTGAREALTTVSATPVNGGVVVTEYALYPNFPNPFNPTTTISFDLPEAANVTLTVFDIMGREIKRLMNDELMVTGRHSIVFEAGSLPNGVYFYRLRAGEFVAQEEDASAEVDSCLLPFQ